MHLMLKSKIFCIKSANYFAFYFADNSKYSDYSLYGYLYIVFLELVERFCLEMYSVGMSLAYITI